jgi:Protein of unknown function (DUF3313)
MMNSRLSLRIVTLLASTFLLTTAFAADKAAIEEAMSYDGLAQIKVKGIDTAYALPGVTLADYSKVMLDPINVSFAKNWDPKKTGSNIKLSAEERENIRTGVAKIVYDEFVKELETKSTYKVVTAAAPDVLRVKADVVNLYVNAPDTMTAGRSRTYTVSAGEMTLVAELRDSESGIVIARAIDRREARNSGPMTLTNSVVNASEARIIASSWARILRTALDNAHGIGKK